MITQEELKEYLHYEAITGIFTWVKDRQKIKIGAKAGSTREDGYITIRINHKQYYAHRLAWLYMTGIWIEQIDHKDLNPSNNIWTNLREASFSQNSGNVRKYANNKSGYKGVSWYPKYQKWVVYIKVGSMHKNLGYYDNKEFAAKIYAEAAAKYFGEFART